MKKICFLTVCLLSFGLVSAQQVINGVYQGSPTSFMFLTPQTGNPNNNQWSDSWVKPRRYDDGEDFISSSTGQSNLGSNGQLGVQTGANYSHRFITTSDSLINVANDDCFRMLDGNNMLRNMGILPLSWNSDLYNVETYETKVIQMGGFTTNRGQHAQEILYSFVPSIDTPVLMLHFAFNTEGAYHRSGGWQGGFAPRNPGVEFAVLEHGTNNYLQLGYYNNDGIHPYSQFWFGTPMGSDNDYTCCGNPDPRNTPSNKALIRLPYSNNCQCDCGSGTYDVHEICTFPYTIVAFDLSEQARNHQAVDFRVREWSCNATLHKSNCYFTAKMIPAKLKVEYCGGDSLKLYIPWGFDQNDEISYKWYNGIDSTNCNRFYPDDPFDSRVLGGSTIYHPLLKPNPEKPYYRCEVVSETGVPFTYEATVNYYLLRPAFFAEPKAISDSVPRHMRTCDYSVVVHNHSQIGIISPKADGSGVDTTWQNLRLNPEQCTWDFGDGTPEVHGFEPTHTYQDTGKYAIKLHIQDFDRICTSFDTIDTVHILREYIMTTDTLKDTVVTCESNLPYYYRPAVFGHDIGNTATTWNMNVAGTIRTVKFTGYNDTLIRPSTGIRDSVVPIIAWNGCDSIARVKFDVLTPTVVINQVGDFCDSAQTLLVASVANVSDEEDVEYTWTYLDTVLSETDELWAMSDGSYSVQIVDVSTDCKASTTFKIDPCVPNIFLPNCITPTKTLNEGPDQNDYFYLDQFVLRFITDVKFSVFSRNGEQLYHYEGKKTPSGEFFPPVPYANLPESMNDRLVLWDGRVKGDVRAGNYVYTLWIVSGGQTYLYKGMLTVM